MEEEGKEVKRRRKVEFGWQQSQQVETGSGPSWAVLPR